MSAPHAPSPPHAQGERTPGYYDYEGGPGRRSEAHGDGPITLHAPRESRREDGGTKDAVVAAEQAPGAEG
ncbi:hypothetical protein [Streptomyces tsukubensis]|uniref:Uncharacterized protein n=1 Tax=Streptomyces tsukubensis TaxID=83656 RepID=A0A1V4AGD1_9ACTN|nr:hypothetical protein [Streptomyces tsukubensis]OON82820.1 hypothetical protein B1H18_01930 [Streptomyces tsukubensis]QFR92005.1 hypothetical protein GBW32_01755 [Streptomyces tsukubensis]